MITKKHLIVLFLIFSIALGCKDGVKKKQVAPKTNLSEQKTNKNPQSVFEKNLKEKPKLFLKFWNGMTREEYQKVVAILIDENVLTGVKKYDGSYSGVRFKDADGCYNYGLNRLSIFPDFNNGKLASIEMYEIKCLWSLYEEKYSLPPFKYKMAIEEKYIENNPKYQPEYHNKDINGNYYSLPRVFQDRTRSLNKGRVYQKINKNYKTPMLVENPLVVKKDDNVMIFEHFKKEFKSMTYSLQQSEALNNYFATDEGSPLNNMMKGEEKFVYTNSVLRTVEIGSSYTFNVTYMSASEYNNKLDKINKSKKEAKEKEKRKNEKRQKTLEIL